MKPPTPVDRHLIIHKAERKMELFDGEKLLRSYKIALGSCPVGDKEIEGDGKTPEGQYYVFVKNPESKFHLSLGLSYPSRASAERGLAAGVITRSEFDSIAGAHEHGTQLPQKTRLGGEIYVHGGGSASDWTEGCIAMTDEEIEEVFAAVPVGTRVTILP
ncbi:MAG TPA: L,D-transpeptidase family protein [Pyrinomonadaceae bacterium]|nr:L,D-transpeptidase family protein [Pyrinomonadaceae bacterium]